jgi:hypothetical protein
MALLLLALINIIVDCEKLNIRKKKKKGFKRRKKENESPMIDEG